MTDAYIEMIKKRERRKEMLGYYAFGLGFGSILLLLSLFGWLNTRASAFDFVFIAGMIAAGIIIASTFLFPGIQDLFRRLSQKIGVMIFGILLSVVYVVFFVPAGWMMRRRMRCGSKTTNFVDHISADMKSSSNRFLHMLNIVRFFAAERSYYVVPIVVVLILLGLLMAFVQTSVVSPLIYVFF